MKRIDEIARVFARRHLASMAQTTIDAFMTGTRNVTDQNTLLASSNASGIAPAAATLDTSHNQNSPEPEENDGLENLVSAFSDDDADGARSNLGSHDSQAEDIGNTSFEEESEDEPTEADMNFINDSSPNGSATAHRQRNNLSNFQHKKRKLTHQHGSGRTPTRKTIVKSPKTKQKLQIKSKASANASNAKSNNFKRKKSGDGDNLHADEDANNDSDGGDSNNAKLKKKTKSNQRDLHILTERGMGNHARAVSEYHEIAPFTFSFANRFVTPWHLQQNQIAQPVLYGKWNNDLQLNWHVSEQQQNFSKYFWTPWSNDIPLRKLKTDVLHPTIVADQAASNATSRVLHFIRSTHAQTELDLIHGKFIQKVFLGLQQTSRELMIAMHGGPNGGLAGCADACLFHISHGDMVTNTNSDILKLVELISEALHGTHGDELCPCIATNYTEPYMMGKRGMQRVQTGGKTVRQYNLHEAGKIYLYDCILFDCI